MEVPSMKTYLSEQLAKHPSMECTDILKQCYQAAKGAEHLLSDLARAKAYLQKEWDATPSEDLPLYEVISPAVARVNIAAWKFHGKELDVLFDLFASSATVPMGSDQVLETYLAEAEEVLTTHRPELLPTWRETLTAYKQAGMPAIHHSASYREAEKPAYRVVRRDLIKDV
jgi:hypothetical protein